MFGNNQMTTNFELSQLAYQYKIDPIKIIFRDELKYYKKEPYMKFIINTSKSNENGMHWVALYIDKNLNGFYFDSFSIFLFDEIIDFVRPNKLFVSKISIQNPNYGYCGQYCLLFLIYMVRNKKKDPLIKFENFLNLWNTI